MLKRKNKAPKSKRKSPVVESLEPRILMSADLPGLDAALPSEDGVEDTDTDKVIADAQAAFRQQQDAQPSPTGEPADDDDIATAFVSDAAATRHELVIVGPHVPDHQQLLADIEARTAADTQIDVVVLDADTDSVDQLSAVFARYSDLDAVHVLSHGSDGAIHIGDDTLDLAAVQRHADAIRAWGDALTADGDLLIYGCDLAASATGEALVDALATLTGADVAASDDRTGHASQGGDWDFEYTTGNIETDDPFSDGLQADYDEVLATYSVTNTNDSGAGSLRQAILDANANTGTDTIDFNISGTGVHTINLTSPLPTINETITIDGSSDDSYAANGSQPAVVLDGSSAGAGANGLVFDAGSDGSTLRGLAVVNFDGVGVLLTNSGGHTVAGNYIGTDGSSDLGNGSWGLEITNSANNVVGGTTSADRNVISGNGVGGITFWGAGSTNNTVIGNYIGTDANGNAGIGNTADGIAFGNGASSNTIGGSADGERNVIAGNGNDGIELNHSGTNNNSIIGNYIGTSADGSADLGNARHGVVIYDGVQGTQVSGNVISGNGQYGVLIDGNSGSGTENNTLTGNYIGTDFTGTVAIGNDAGGVYLFNGANGNVIGGRGVGDGNLVAFNGGRGIELTSGAGSGNQLLGNTVTQNVASGVYSYADGTEIIGNVVYNNSTGFSYDEVVLGSNQTVYHNTIHGAKDDGISVEGSSAIIRNNIITGSAGYGIRIAGGSISTESYNLITDAVTGPANLGGRANFALDASDLNDDPLYRDSANGDFRLTSPTSPAIDAGLDFGLTQPDVNGADAGKYGGTAPDIGTLEIWAPVSNPPTDLQAVSAQSGGLSLNSDGGNDAYVIADDGGAIMGGLTALTAEIRFSSTANADTQPLLTYATATTDKELSILLHDSGDLRLWLAESSAHSSAIDYRSLADGDAHTLSFSWDNGSGDWAIYVDGAVVDSGTGLASGQTLDGGGAIVFGQDQDSLDGGYSSTQVFDGTLYDARIFSDARTASEIAASYASELVYDEQGMLANWRFDNLSTDGVVTDTVSGNNLTVQHASGTGFTTSTPTLTFAVDDNAADGSVVGSVAGTDPERDVLIASLLASESNLRYNAETGKFYEIVGGAHFWGDARTAAESSTLNGVSGQLVTIRSAAENAFLTDLVNSTIGYSVWIGATDATVEGEWRWVDGGSEADLFWLGDENGSNPAGVYHNFAAGQPNDVGNNEDVARLDTNGTWLDGDHDNHDYYGYIIEWNADDVLDNAGPVDEQPLTYTIASQTVAGAFAINADSGQVSVANGSLLDASANATHTVTVRVTDVDGNTYDEAFTIALTSTAPTDLLSVSTQSGGLSLNEDGGNDAYLIADDGGAIFGGMTALTAEVRFAMDAFPNSTNFFSYATSGDDNVVKFNIRDNGDLSFAINSNYAFSSAMDYRTLADGDPHTLSVTWDSSGGLWEMFVDGASVDSGSGLQSGATLAGGGTLVMGNDQDSVDGGYDTTSEAAATLYDARIFNVVRTDGEVLANYSSTLPYDESGMVANWTFNDLSADGVVTDTVSGNNLTVKHASGTGFVTSNPELTFAVDENALDGVEVGVVAGTDTERTDLIASLLAADPDLVYSAETGKFYKAVTGSTDWASASTAALGTTLNGADGQLATIRSANEQEIAEGIVSTAGAELWLGGTDQTVEGEHRWTQDGADADQFWSGDQTGTDVDGAYSNWLSGRPDNFGGDQHFVYIRTDGYWNDENAVHTAGGYLVEWDADEVLDVTQALSYSIQSQTVAGAFAIDADSGRITVADGSLLDHEANAAHSVTFRVTDVDGKTHDETVTIALKDLAESASAPTDLSSGIELNTDGGNDAYLSATDANFLLGAEGHTYEVRFSGLTSMDSMATLYSHRDPGNAQSYLAIHADGTLNWAGLTSSGTYTQLMDGGIHSLAVTWDASSGSIAFFVDGEYVESTSVAPQAAGTGGPTFVLGQHVDYSNGSMDSTEAFSGVFHDFRVWDHARSADEIALNHQHKFDSGSLPTGLLANWQMDGFNGSNEVVDVVSGNNLSIGHAAGAGFIASTPVGDLNVDENSANVTSVGFVMPSDPDVSNDVVSDGRFLEASDPGSYALYSATQTFGDWTVTTGNVAHVGTYWESSPLGGKTVDLNGNTTGGISQTFSTEAGRQYQVVFALTGNWEGGEATKDVRVSAAGQSQDFAITQPSNWSISNLLWQNRSLTFTADSTSTALDFLSLDSAGYGPIIGDVQVIEIPQAVSTILNNDPTLDYDAATGKFYRLVSTPDTFSGALTAATSAEVNGVTGQLGTIRSDYEQGLFRDFQARAGTDIWLGASDATTEGDWYWLDGTADSEQFWQGGGTSGSAISGKYVGNFSASDGADEDYLRLKGTGTWADLTAGSSYAYVIEWDAAEVLSAHTFALTDDAGGRFAIDADTGEITVANGSLLDYEAATSHNVTVEVTDAAGNTYSETMAIAVNDVDQAPTDIVFDSDSGSEVDVNDYTATDQIDPTIATFADGSYIVTWVSGTPADGYNVYAKVYDADGSIKIADFVVSSEIGDHETNPSVTTFADGGFAIAWQDQTSGVWAWTEARLFDADGTPTTAEFKLNPGTDGDGEGYQPAVLALSNDEFVAVWANETGGTSYDVVGQRYDRSGATVGAQFTLGTLASGTGLFGAQAELALLDDGGFAAIWRTHDGASTDVSLRVMNADGTARSAVVNPGGDNVADVASLSNGGFVVTYDDGGALNATIYDANGAVVVAEFQVNTTASAARYESTVTRSDDGFVVVWESDSGDTGGSAVLAQRFDNAGAKVGSEVVVNETEAGNQQKPEVAVTASGQVIAVWQSDNVDGDQTGIVSRIVTTGSASVAENAANGTRVVDVIGVMDLDAGDTHTFTLSDDAGGRFAINATTGVITVANGSLLDYEASASHNVTVRVTDSYGNTYDEVLAVDITNVNEDPTIANLDGDTLNYSEGDGAVPIDQGTAATVVEPDLTDFAGGDLNVEIDGGLQAGDTLAIRNQGSGAGQIGVSGSDVTYAGVVIGTFTGGSGATPLNIVFNSNATAAAVQALVQNVTFENTDTDNPTAGSRSVTIDLTDGDGGSSVTQNVTVNVSAVNDDPTNTGSTPTDVTLIEDTPGFVDLSSITFEDVDAGNNLIQVMLTTSSGGVLFASSDFDVTVVGSGFSTMVLQGGVSDLNNFFGAANRFQYFNPNTHLAGDNADTIQITVNDLGNTGSGGGTNIDFGTVNVDITPVNDAPVLTAGTVSNLTVGEDSGLTSLGLGGVSYAPGGGTDEAGQTLSYAVTTIPAPANGDIFLADGTTRVTTGSYTLAQIQGMQFRPADDWNGVTAFQFNVTDSGGTANGGSDSISQFILITVNAANDAPTVDLNGTDGGGSGFAATFIEGGGAVSVADTDAIVTDVDSSSYNGLSLNFATAPDGSAEKLTVAGYTFSHGVSEVVVRTVGGTDFDIDFDGSGFSIQRDGGGTIPDADLEALIRGISYENTSQDPTAGNRTLDFVAIDDQGLAGAVAQSVVTVTPVNDGPTFGTTNGVTAFTENGGAVGLFSGTSVDTVESGDLVDSILLAVDGLADGSNEVLVVDGQAIELTHLNNETTATNGYDVSVTVSGTSATVQISKTGGFSAAAAEGLVDGLAYDNTSENPQGAARTVTLTSITDDGGTANGGTDTTSIGLASLVTIDAVNDAPVNSVPGAQTVAEDTALVFNATNGNLITVSDVDAAGSDLAMRLIVSNGTVTLGTTAGLSFTTGDGSDDADVLFSGTLAEINAALDGLTFNPTQHFNGAASIQLVLNDSGNTGSGGALEDNDDVVAITVTPQPDAPTIGGVDTGSVTEDVDPDTDNLLETAGTLTISDPDAGESSFQSATVAGTYGSLTIDTAGNWTYEADNTQAAIQQLDAGESVNDVLTVTTADGTTHNVTVTINGAEDAPVLGGTTTGTVAEDGTLTANGTLSISDVDTSDNPVSYPDVAATAGDNGYGTFEITGNTWTYNLNNGHAAVQALDAGESLSDTHTFTASDGSTQVVTVTINGAEDAPVLGGTTTGTVAEDGTSSASGTLSISDVDTSDNPISYPDVGATAGDNGYGTFEITGNTWTYNLNNGHAAVQALDAGENLADTHTFTASDGSTQVVTVTINGAEDAPVITGTTTGTVAEDGTLTANGTLSISDVDSSDNPISFPDEASTPGDNGYGSFQLTGGTWAYTLNNGHAAVQALDAGESLSDTHTFTASDGSTQVVTVTINGAEDAPVITGTTTGTVAEDGTLTANGTLSISDVDSSDNPISFPDEASTPGDNGYGSFQLAGGTWTYTLNNGHAVVQALDNGESLTDTHTFTASDGSTQVVTITINGAEDTPVITGTTTGTVAEDGALTANGTLSISDADTSDNPVSFPDEASTAGDNGYGSFQLTGGTWTYTLNNGHAAVQALDAGESLTDTHTFTASDGSTQVVTVTINGAEDAPVLGGTTAGAVSEDGTSSASGTLSISDVDTSDNPVSYPDVGATAGDNGFGTFEITGNTWTYNLNNGHAAVQALDAGESLTDTYTFTASDGSTQLVTVTINGAEDAPVLGGTTTGTVAEDGALTANGTLSISDVDSSDNPISFPDEASTLGDNGYGSFALTGGTWTYTLNNGHATVQALDAGESLSDTHTFTASDGSTQAVTVTINGAEDAPVITGTTTGSVAEDGALTANGTLSVSDTDTSDNPISFADEASTVGDNGYGSFALTGGTWTYTLNNGHAAVQALDAGESLSDTHTFTASDGSTQVVTATINGAEDAPVITATASGSVTVDGAQTTSGSLSISDADASDNPIGFADVAVTAGDNGYGSFELSGGTWTYTLDGTHAAVQALGGDQSLTDSHTFIASDGSTQLVTVTINGVDQVVGDPVTPPWPDPPNDDDEEGEPPVPPDVDDDPPDDQPDPVPPVDEDPDGDGTGEPPREDDNDGVITFPSATPMPAHQPLPSDEVLLSVLGDRDNNQSQAASTKPSVEQARTFVQELKAIWTEQPELAPPALQNVTQSEAFWIDVDEMLNDFDEDAEKQQRLEKIGAEAAAGVGVSLTAGFVSWALRAGSMAASFLAAMPTWRSFDPMPVLAADDEKKRRTVGDAADDDDDAEEQDDAKVDRMFDR